MDPLVDDCVLVDAEEENSTIVIKPTRKDSLMDLLQPDSSASAVPEFDMKAHLSDFVLSMPAWD
jgi:hypothetical protein